MSLGCVTTMGPFARLETISSKRMQTWLIETDYVMRNLLNKEFVGKCPIDDKPAQLIMKPM